jgi:MFS family permease
MSRSKAFMLYFLVSLFLFFEMGVQVSPSVMANQLMHSFQVGTFGLGLMSGFYFYTYAAMQIPSGLLLDKYNPRSIITIAILVCVLGILVFSFATNIYMASLGRLLMGFGSAFAFVSVLVVTADLFPAKYFATLTGVTQMLAALGAMCGQVPVSLLTTQLGWRPTLLLLGSIGAVLAVLTWSVLKYKRCNTMAFEAQQTFNRNSLTTIFKNNQTWLVAIYACLLWAPMSGFASLWGVPFLQHVDLLTKSQAAFISSFMWVGLAVASPLLGWYATKTGKVKRGLYLSALLGFLAFMFVVIFNLPSYLLIILICLAGAACSGQALSFTLVKENNNNYNRGTAIAINNMAVVISGAVFQPLIGKLIEVFQQNNSPLNSYQYALSLILLTYLAGFIVALFFIKRS